jgi:hypothetical protein
VLAVRNVVLKIGLRGDLYLDGRPITESELPPAITALNAEGSAVTYYRESPETQGSAASADSFERFLALKPKLIRMGIEVPSEWGKLDWIEIEEAPQISRIFLAAGKQFLISFPAPRGKKPVVFLGGPLPASSEAFWLGQFDFIIRCDRVLETPPHDPELCFTPAASTQPSLHMRLSYGSQRRWASRYLPSDIPGNIASFHADAVRVARRMTSGSAPAKESAPPGM